MGADTKNYLFMLPVSVTGKQVENGKASCRHPEKHWQYKPSTLDEMDARGEIYWSPTGNPRRKIYLENSAGIPVQDIWMNFRDAHNQNIHITGYPTEKNPALLSRIIDIIKSRRSCPRLLCRVWNHIGGGIRAWTWIGVDRSQEAIKTILHRIANGSDQYG